MRERERVGGGKGRMSHIGGATITTHPTKQSQLGMMVMMMRLRLIIIMIIMMMTELLVEKLREDAYFPRRSRRSLAEPVWYDSAERVEKGEKKGIRKDSKREAR